MGYAVLLARASAHSLTLMVMRTLLRKEKLRAWRRAPRRSSEGLLSRSTTAATSAFGMILIAQSWAKYYCRLTSATQKGKASEMCARGGGNVRHGEGEGSPGVISVRGSTGGTMPSNYR